MRYGRGSLLAVDQTVIPLTLSLPVPVDTPTKRRGGCSRMTEPGRRPDGHSADALPKAERAAAECQSSRQRLLGPLPVAAPERADNHVIEVVVVPACTATSPR